MEPTQHDRDINWDCSVTEDAFWHSNMDLYYGYDRNELVEVEHEPCKYWLARIIYNYRQLLLLRWECDYGEFWLDTSANSKRRCYPPGHYLQPSLKSQYEFKRPPKPLTRKDPYANIRNVEDLLSAEEPVDHSDATKCKNIPFKPEDAEELEAALQALNELNCDSLVMDCEDRTIGDEQVAISVEEDDLKAKQDSSNFTDCSIFNNNLSENSPSSKDIKVREEDELEKETRLDEERLHACKTIRHKAIEEYKSKIAVKSIIPKPRQFYDLGGVGPDRLFVPGAILEVCHYKNSPSSASKPSIDVKVNSPTKPHTLNHWFAIVTENIGGRLTLRWLLSDDPKFKQGRLEIKSIGCSYVEEETSSINDEPDQVKKIPVKEVSFRLHYCHPSISTVGNGQTLGRTYSLPEHVENSMLTTLEQPHFSYLLQQVDTQDVTTALGELVKAKSKRLVGQIKKRLHDAVFDSRRINLDKDRPLIDYFLYIIKKRCPRYIDATLVQEVEKEVLVSTPKTTKILPGKVKHIFEPGIFLVETQVKSCDNESKVLFVYPYDSSYTLLPLSWGARFKDCLNTDSQSASIKDILKNNNAQVCSSKDLNTSDAYSDDSVVNSSAVSLEVVDEKPSPSGELNEYPVADESSVITIQDNGKDDMVDTPSKNLMVDQVDQVDSETSRDTIIETLKMDEASLELINKFKISHQLEVVHPSSDAKIISGRIRRISPPLLWIQISNDSYTVLPFNSTDIFPLHFCERNNHPLIYKLPIDIGSLSKSNKKNDGPKDLESSEPYDNQNTTSIDSYDAFNIDKISDKQDDMNDLITESAWCTRIFFNHKCFSGPALSKGKICSLPQYVGPGPVRLVMEEVVTKVISVAYVPPRILNDLSSKNFEDLLISRNIINTSPLTFKAKYQKRVYREELPVIINAEDVESFCECICEHLKCCYNLFGPNLYDGDDCPGHCRGLTKSNKFMKRAIYYREKARLGEFVSDANKKNASKNSDAAKNRQNYGGRASQDSTGSRCKTPRGAEVSKSNRDEPLEASTTQIETTIDDKNSSQDILKAAQVSDESEKVEPSAGDPNLTLSPLSSSDQENLINTLVSDQCNMSEGKQDEKISPQNENNLETNGNLAKRKRSPSNLDDYPAVAGLDSAQHESRKKLDRVKKQSTDIELAEDLDKGSPVANEYCPLNNYSKMDIETDDIDQDIYSEVFQWSVEDVYKFVKESKYSQFAAHLREQEIDGPAFLLLDITTLKEHFISPSYSSHSSTEICGLSEFIQDLGKRVYTTMKLSNL